MNGTAEKIDMLFEENKRIKKELSELREMLKEKLEVTEDNHIKNDKNIEDIKSASIITVCKPESPVACIAQLIQKHKGDKIYTSEFHKMVKEKCEISPQQIKVIISSMGYDIKQRNGVIIVILLILTLSEM